jgi:predicted secreted hydrolase
MEHLTNQRLAENDHMRGWIQFDPAKDLGAHRQTVATSQQATGSYYAKGPLPRRQADGDSYYIVSYLNDDQGHRFTVFFHFFIAYKEALERSGFKEALALLDLNRGFAQAVVSILDEADTNHNSYVSRAHQLTPEQIGLADETPSNVPELDLKTPLGSLEGTIDSIRLRATLPRADQASMGGEYSGEEWKIDLLMKDDGLRLPYLAVGIIPFDKEIDYEYALPSMVTSGTLRFGSISYKMTGTSWFDREWGHFGPCKWTWMAIDLSNGIKIALWDQQDNGDHPQRFAEGQSAFATLLEPGGSIAVASVELQEEAAFDSPRSHQRYPSRWSVTIPAKKIELHIELLRNDQEIIPSEELTSGRILTPRLEGKASVRGVHEGQRVQGNAFVELFNLFPAFAMLRAAQLHATSAPKVARND